MPFIKDLYDYCEYCQKWVGPKIKYNKTRTGMTTFCPECNKELGTHKVLKIK